MSDKIVDLNMGENSHVNLNIPQGAKLQINVICDEAIAAAPTPEKADEARKVKKDIETAQAAPTNDNTKQADKTMRAAVKDGAITQEQYVVLKRQLDSLKERVDIVENVMPKDDEGNLIVLTDYIEGVVYGTLERHFGTFLEEAGINVQTLRFSIGRFLAGLIAGGLIVWLIMGLATGWVNGLFFAVIVGLVVGLGFGLTGKKRAHNNTDNDDNTDDQPNAQQTPRASHWRRNLIVFLVIVIVIVVAVAIIHSILA